MTDESLMAHQNAAKMTVMGKSIITPRLGYFALLISILILASTPWRVVAFGVISTNLLRPSGMASLRRTRLDATTASSVVIYGHPGTRSPLVNWALLELQVPFEMGDLDNNPHPFQQMPCVTDGDAMIFESGAILSYLQQTYGTASRADAAAILSWIVWANASFDPICFLETPNGKVYDTGLKQPNRKVSRLNEILEQNEWITGATFTIADVAIASYGLYVCMFFPDVNIARYWPKLAQYLLRAAQRPAYGKAFGPNVQKQMVDKLTKDVKQYAK